MNRNPLAHTLLHLTSAAILGSLAGAILFVLKIGPVALTLTATHGVHTGDLLAVLPALGAALLVRRALTGTPVTARA